MNFTKVTAIVSGGGSGLGAATARHLACLGAAVGVLDVSENGAVIASEIGGAAEQVDITDATATGMAMDRLSSKLARPVRLVVNCVGIAPAARVLGRDGGLSTDLFSKVIEVNLLGSFNVMSHAARLMAECEPDEDRQRGLIVNTSSVAFEDGQVGQTAYAASKGGVAALTLPAARDLARHGIRVVAIAPGLFNTPMMEALPTETTEEITKNIPNPARLGHPSEYARAVQHLAENNYFNATTLRLDGGVRLPIK